MKPGLDGYRVGEGEAVDLDERPTLVPPAYQSKEEYRELLSEHVGRLSALQHLLYASESFALLIIFQGMDTAGKDGAIAHVMSGVNPQGCKVIAFKQPTAEELRHDFLWRCHARLPERGQIGIFNRSYYEEVVVVRVHPHLLAAAGFPPQAAAHKRFWKERLASIVDFEAHLSRNHVRVVKVFLHLSKEEQRKRFLARIDEPNKNWKFNMDDVVERKRWKDYMKAYTACLSATSTPAAPWYVVPADDKPTARLIVSQIIVETLAAMQLGYPKIGAKRRGELKAIRKELEK